MHLSEPTAQDTTTWPESASVSGDSPSTVGHHDGRLPISQVGMLGSTPHGAAGMHHLMYGYTRTQPGLSFTLFGELSHARNLLFADDSVTRTTQDLAIWWTISRHLELGAYLNSSLLQESVFPGATAFNVLPGLGVKGNSTRIRDVALGASFNYLVPPLGADQSGLALQNAVYTLQGLASKPLGKGFELTLNLGGIIDRSRQATAEFANPAQRFSTLLARANRITAGLGATRQLDPIWHNVTLSPYAELMGEWAFAGPYRDNPERLTVGTKAFFLPKEELEVDVGVDVRLSGAPRLGSVYAGLAPWAAYLSVSYHSPWAALGFVQERVVIVNRGGPPKPTVTFEGFVHDSNKQVLSEARVSLSGDHNMSLTVDPGDGRFQTEAFIVDAHTATLEASAPGYVTERRTVPLAPGGGAARVDFNLTRKAPTADVLVRAYDAAKRVPIPQGHVLVPGETDIDVTLDKKGKGRFTISPGRYELIISAPGYQMYRVKVEVPDDAELVVNAGLKPRPK